APLLLPATAVAPTSAVYDGQVLRVGWNASPDAGVTHYVATVWDGAVAAASATAAGTEAAIPFAGVPGRGYAAGVRACIGRGTGPSGGTLAVLLSTPAILGVTSAEDGTQVTARWTTVADPGCTGYRVELLEGGAAVRSATPAGRDTAETTFDATLVAGRAYAVRVRATGAGAGGPWSAAVPLPSQAPAVSVDYDGATVRARWSPVAGATAYRAVLRTEGDPSRDVAVETARGEAAFPLDGAGAAGRFGVRVRTVAGTAAGPASGPSPVVAPGWALSADAAKPAALLPADDLLPAAARAVSVYLPELYATRPSTLPSSGAFALQAAPAGSALPLLLTFAADGAAWRFDSSAVRAGVWTDYATFLSMLEGRAKEQDPATIGVLRPGAVQAVQGAIARRMPQTFAETLRYACGLSADGRWADLRAGMRLRVDFQAWQTVPARDSVQNGFAGGASVEADVGVWRDGTGAPRIGFDAFLARLQGFRVPTPKGSAMLPYPGGGGVVDLGSPEFQQPFCRVLYPSTFPTANDAGKGFLADSPVFLAAADWTTLSAVTQAFRASPGAVEPLGPGYALTALRGRALPEPRITVTLNGAPVDVAVGTTLGGLLARFGAAPAAPSLWRGVRMTRAAAPADAAGAGPRAVPVRLGWGAAAAYADGTTWLDLPLLPGDRVEA
ncbi:MAG TPA: hypothetical protein VHG93_25535, partial [Longimicrobium sp.]|nr:hypothetical protein [Longimicrobium sp.]